MALLLVAGCSRERAASEAPASATPAKQATSEAPALQVGATEQLADGSTRRSWHGDHFVIEWIASACAAAAECTAELRLRATAGFHLNAEYPYKFVPKADDGVSYLAKQGAFSKAAGDWSVREELGVLSLRYRPQHNATQAPLRGTFRLSVCNESACQIETPSLDLDVPLRG